MLASHEKKKKRKKKRKRKTKHGRDKKKKKRNHESKHPSSDDSDDKPLRKSVTPMGGTSMALSRFLHQSGMQLQGGQQEGNEFQRDGTFDYAFDTDKEDHSCTSAFSKDHLHHLARKVSAEAIGVYFLVTTVGLCAAQGLDLGPVAVGCMVMSMIYTFGHISGAHFNPAVTLGFTVRGRMCAVSCLAYIIAQFLGGAAAAAITSTALSHVGRTTYTCAYNATNAFPTCGVGYPTYNTDFQLWSAVVIEGAYAFALTTMAINLEYQDYDYFFAGLANFGWIAGSGIAGGAVSGAAYNPVVGTVLAMSQDFPRDIWIYCLAPSLGGMLAGLVFRFTADPEKIAEEDHRAKYIFGNMRIFGNNPPKVEPPRSTAKSVRFQLP